MKSGLFQDYFADNAATLNGIKGLMILDTDKQVTGAFWPGRESDAEATLGTSYSGITFRGDQDSPYKHLTLFRTDSDNPRGLKGEEIAYKLPGQAGWLVFQLDMERLNMEFGIDVSFQQGPVELKALVYWSQFVDTCIDNEERSKRTDLGLRR